MDLVALILLLVAAILFAVEFMRSNWQSLTSLGLCLLTVGLIVQFTSDNRSVIF